MNITRAEMTDLLNLIEVLYRRQPADDEPLELAEWHTYRNICMRMDLHEEDSPETNQANGTDAQNAEAKGQDEGAQPQEDHAAEG